MRDVKHAILKADSTGMVLMGTSKEKPLKDNHLFGHEYEILLKEWTDSFTSYKIREEDKDEFEKLAYDSSWMRLVCRSITGTLNDKFNEALSTGITIDASRVEIQEFTTECGGGMPIEYATLKEVERVETAEEILAKHSTFHVRSKLSVDPKDLVWNICCKDALAAMKEYRNTPPPIPNSEVEELRKESNYDFYDYMKWMIEFAIQYHDSKKKGLQTDISNDASEFLSDKLSLQKQLSEAKESRENIANNLSVLQAKFEEKCSLISVQQEEISSLKQLSESNEAVRFAEWNKLEIEYNRWIESEGDFASNKEIFNWFKLNIFKSQK